MLAIGQEIWMQPVPKITKCFFKWQKPGLFLFFRYFNKYSTNLTINDKSVAGMLGTQTRGGRMVGADESTELWQHLHKMF